GTGQHQRTTRGGGGGQRLQPRHARGHVAMATEAGTGVQVGVVGAFMAPAQPLRDLGQRADLVRMRPALEAVREDAVAARAHAATHSTASPRYSVPPSSTRAHSPPMPRIAL